MTHALSHNVWDKLTAGMAERHAGQSLSRTLPHDAWKACTADMAEKDSRRNFHFVVMDTETGDCRLATISFSRKLKEGTATKVGRSTTGQPKRHRKWSFRRV